MFVGKLRRRGSTVRRLSVSDRTGAGQLADGAGAETAAAGDRCHHTDWSGDGVGGGVCGGVLTVSCDGVL